MQPAGDIPAAGGAHPPAAKPYAYQPPPQAAAPPAVGAGGSGFSFGESGGFSGDGQTSGSVGQHSYTSDAMGYSAGAMDGAAAARAPAEPAALSWRDAFLGGGLPDEPPILVELGINFQHIHDKTRLVLWPKRSKLETMSPLVQDDDFAGPLLFCLMHATLLVFQGKLRAGTIYGVFASGCLGVWAVVNLMSQKGIEAMRVVSVMGYSLIPIVLLAALSIFVDMRSLAGAIFIPPAVMWCAYAASLFFVAALDADDRRWLFAYPVALFYTCFALITVF